jgi:hypothetical protein
MVTNHMLQVVYACFGLWCTSQYIRPFWHCIVSLHLCAFVMVALLLIQAQSKNDVLVQK